MVPSSWRRQLAGTLKVQVEHLALCVAQGDGNFLSVRKAVSGRPTNAERGSSRQILLGLSKARRAEVLERRGRYFSRPPEEWAADLGVPTHAVVQFRQDFADKWVPKAPRRAR